MSIQEQLDNLQKAIYELKDICVQLESTNKTESLTNKVKESKTSKII